MAVDRRLVKLVNSAIVEHMFWLVNSDAEEEATQPCALLALGGCGFYLGAGKTRSQPVLDCPSREKCLYRAESRHPLYALLGSLLLFR